MGDAVGVTPLMLAATTGHIPLAQILLQFDSLHRVDARGNSPLHYAYAYCKSPMARWIEAQAKDLESKENSDGHTPLDVSGFGRKLFPTPSRDNCDDGDDEYSSDD
ncbi:hypothetical protein LEN26_004865 [Aphanomyces euteiches]|nr:hypothetical protein AeMF1_004039 [Aphanomyces euteiches]KAH9146929.1 hypothetical protein LEN26_004865 [Aphanomyces euteiches]KAH9185522.1 hypothetical protein AeNC1_012499 [Aphanomyces euteiches]